MSVWLNLYRVKVAKIDQFGAIKKNVQLVIQARNTQVWEVGRFTRIHRLLVNDNGLSLFQYLLIFHSYRPFIVYLVAAMVAVIVQACFALVKLTRERVCCLTTVAEHGHRALHSLEWMFESTCWSCLQFLILLFLWVFLQMEQEVRILSVHNVIELRYLVYIVFFRGGLVYPIFYLINLLHRFFVALLAYRLTVTFFQQFN